jgi:predicted dehydrogenase
MQLRSRIVIKVAVVGMGFMGRTHVGSYQAAAKAGLPCQLAAVCDPDPARLTGEAQAGGNLSTTASERLFDPARVRGYTDFDALLASDVHLISICTYTDSHVDLAIRALRAGKHVLVEKPVALRSADVARLLEASEQSRFLCVPAMCMRFWPGWDWLRAQLDLGEQSALGKVRSATFQRLGSGPTWASGFYTDHTRSGGAVIDLHIHDADFITWCFGTPVSVTSAGDLLHITTQYRFLSGPAHVTAEGAWDLAPGAGFRMRYLVNFEKGTAEFDLAKDPVATIHTAEGSSPMPIGTGSGYDGQVRAIIEAIAGGDASKLPRIAEAFTVAKVLEAELESLRTGAIVRL